MTKFIGIVSGKGGVGKTIVAINLASAMTQFGRKAVLVDANLNKPNVAIYLGSPLNETTLNDAIKGTKNISDCVYLHHSGITLIPADITHEVLDAEFHKKFADAVLPLTGKAEVVIIDTPGGFSEEAKHVLKACDEAILITTPEMSSLVDSLKTINFCNSHGVVVTALVLNRVHSDKLEEEISTVESFLGKPVIAVIKEDNSIRESVAIEYPVVLSHPSSQPTEEFKKLAALLLGESYVEKLERKSKESLFNYMLRRLGLR